MLQLHRSGLSWKSTAQGASQVAGWLLPVFEGAWLLKGVSALGPELHEGHGRLMKCNQNCCFAPPWRQAVGSSHPRSSSSCMNTFLLSAAVSLESVDQYSCLARPAYHCTGSRRWGLGSVGTCNPQLFKPFTCGCCWTFGGEGVHAMGLWLQGSLNWLSPVGGLGP